MGNDLIMDFISNMGKQVLAFCKPHPSGAEEPETWDDSGLDQKKRQAANGAANGGPDVGDRDPVVLRSSGYVDEL